MAASARGDDKFARTETKTYAEKVVKDVLRGRKGRIWRGKAAGMIRWSNWLPVWVMVSSIIFRYFKGLFFFFFLSFPRRNNLANGRSPMGGFFFQKDGIMKKGTGLNAWWFQETVRLRKKEI